MNHQKSKQIELTGPWPTKSGGELRVLFNFNKNDANEFMHASRGDISGLRAYRVTDLSKGARGADEWHKVRTELAFVTRGSVTWHLKHRDGSEQTIRSTASSDGVEIPPNVLHTYIVDEDGTELLVIANTSFNPNDASTHDTYSKEQY